MKSKKILSLGLLAATLTLASCDIYPDLDFDYITIDDTSEDQVFTEDDLTYLYEKLHDTDSTGEEVRDYILLKYANVLLGEFSMDESGNIIIEGYDDATEAEKLEFVQAHEPYWDLNEDNEGVEPTAITSTIENRIDVIRNLIKKEIIETLFDEINTESYVIDNYFYEYLYAREIFENYEVGDFDPGCQTNNIYETQWETDYEDLTTEELASYPFTNHILLDSSISSDNIDSIIGTDNNSGIQVLHIELYNDYINKEILPDIMINLLVSQYIYDNQYSALSRTQSRHINYIGIPYDSSNVNAARRLINSFVTNVIENGTATTRANYEPIDFEVLSDLWKGVYDDNFATTGYDITVSSASSDIEQMYSDARITKVTSHGTATGTLSSTSKYIDGIDHTYYQYTQYGNLMEDFAKMNNNRNDADSEEQWDTFTGSNTYTYQHGLQLEINEIRCEDYTGEGWGTSGTGFSDLPAAVTDNLFQYDVGIEATIDTDEFDSSSYYITLVNGRYFLKRSTSLSSDLTDSIVINDTENSVFYIVEVIDALSQNKMSLSTTSEDGAYDTDEKFEIARDIGYSLATGDTYTNTAYLHYLEKCNIKYHDTSIYEYMLENYPDLFDDDD